MANLNSKAGGAVQMNLPDVPDSNTPMEANGNGYLLARLQRVQSDAQLLNIAFGNGTGDQSLLFATQLLSAFGPEKDKSEERGGFV